MYPGVDKVYRVWYTIVRLADREYSMSKPVEWIKVIDGVPHIHHILALLLDLGRV